MGMRRGPSLSFRERQCIFLRVVGLSYCQIAEILGISMNTVSMTMHRSYYKLRIPRNFNKYSNLEDLRCRVVEGYSGKK